MGNEIDPIAGIQATIRDMERDLAMLKQSANVMSSRLGRGQLYSDAELKSDKPTIGTMRTDQFYGKSIVSAMREYLAMRQASNLGPATVPAIHDALVAGGCGFETEDVENRKRGMRAALTKSTAIFHRMPDGAHFGLREWYPGVKEGNQQPKGKRRGKRKQKSKKESDGDGDTETTERAKSTTSKVVSLLEAVRLAIEDADGDFTKQDVLEWIQKYHPGLKAEERKQSVFTTVNKLKDELGIETVKEGKGSEPFIFRRKKG